MSTNRAPLHLVTEAGYRDAEGPLRARRAELILARRAEAAMDGEAARIYARRVARAAASLPAIAGAAALPVIALATYAMRRDFETRGLLTFTLLAIVPLALVAYLVARVVARAVFHRRVAAALTPTDDLHGDVARLERRDGEAFAADVADALERRSVSLPLIALALATPLTIHFFVWLAIRAMTDQVDDFDSWIKMSLILVTHCHLLLAFLGWRFARALRERPLTTSGARAGWLSWLWTWASAAVPGAVLVLIPVAIVFATGIVFVPLSFWAFARVARRERAQLAALQAARS